MKHSREGAAVRLLSWAALAFVLGAAVALLVLIHLVGGRLQGEAGRAYTTVAVAIANVAFGGLLVRRLPRNSIGWILIAFAVGVIATAVTPFYGVYALQVDPSLPAGSAAAWFSGWGGFPPFGLMVTLLVLLFPDGQVPSLRWRKLAVGTCGFLIVVTVAEAVLSLPRHGGAVGVDDRGHILISETIGGDVTDALVGLGFLGLLILCAASVVGLFLRRRRAEPVMRQQLKWFLFACAFIFAFGFLPHFVTAFLSLPPVVASSINSFFAATFVLIPVAAGFAVLKYRLYDIDVVINRTLVYGALGAFITAVYVAIVVGVGTLVGSGGKPNLLLSIAATAVVAVAFQPVRERVQRFANRVVYGKRATPYEVLSEFSARVAESYAGEQVLPRMAEVLAQGTGAESATVWLRSGNSLRPAAVWPGAREARDVAIELASHQLPSLPGDGRAVAVRHQGALLGALSISKRTGESLTPIEEKLLDDLAHQAGLVLRNVGLTADLQARLLDLRASRQRLVAAQDEERRRLERNLHDGAQQHLVAIKVKLGLVQSLALKDPDRAMGLMGELKADADEALTTLRDLARGIYPPLLAERGLAAALESQGRKATVDVRVATHGVARYTQDVEAAVYFCVLEALQNTQKYARATTVTVTVDGTGNGLSAETSHHLAPDGGRHGGELRFTVDDDGQGFDPAATRRGAGLQNMEDRLHAIGGSLELISAPGRGTRLTGRLPVPTAVAP